MGLNQSPVAIVKAIHSPELRKLRFIYGESVAKVGVLNGVVPFIRPTTGNKLHAVGEVWSLEDILLHSPAEHILNDIQYDLEIQLRHRNSKGHRVNVSVFIEEGGKHRDIGRSLTILETRKDQVQTMAGVDIRTFIPQRKSYYMYNGSETIPPCTEGVRWFLLKKPLTMSPGQLDTFLRVIGRNNRDLQDLNLRVAMTNR